MINIMEAGRSISKQSACRFLTDLKVYTIGNELSIVIQTLFFCIYNVCSFFAKMVKKPLKEYEISTWNVRQEKVWNEISVLQAQPLSDALEEALAKYIHIPRRYRRSDDALSSYIVRFATKGFPKGAMEGLSIPEKVEYIYQNYPHLKEKNERKALSTWFLLSFLLLILFIWFMTLAWPNCSSSILLFALTELCLTWYVLKRMRIRWAIHFVWLARTEYGQKLIDATLMLEQLSKQDSTSLQEDLQLLQSYLWLYEREQDTLNRLSTEKDELEQKVDKNRERIQVFQQRNDPDSDRMRDNLNSENCSIYQQIKVINMQLSAVTQKRDLFYEKLSAESQKNVLLFTNLWKCYSKIDFDTGVLNSLLHNLFFEDLKKVEKRLYELNYATDALALTEHKNDKDFLSFRTEQGDIAKLYVSCAKTTGKCLIQSFEREVKLQISPLTEEAIRRVLERRGESASLSEEILQHLKRIEELDAEAKKLRDEKHRMDILLQQQLKEISNLTTNMQSTSKKCRQLELELQKAAANKEHADKIIAEYEEKQAELLRLAEEAFSRKKDFAVLKQKYDALQKRIQENRDASQLANHELEEQNKSLCQQIAALESSLKFQEQVLDETKKKHIADKEALQKLETANEQLKKTLKSSINEKNKLEQKKKEQLQKNREHEAEIAKYKERLRNAQVEARKAVEAMQEAQKDSSCESYQRTFREIQKTFPRLSHEALTFFASAEQFYKCFGNGANIDYSIIIVEYCKVLETELWKFLESSTEYEEAVQKSHNLGHHNTLGSAVYIINHNLNKSLGKYGSLLFDIKEMRNSGAHNGLQDHTQVEKVKTFVWTSGILADITKSR